MPVHRVEGGWQWGAHGHVYPTREGAEKQAAAAHANGYTEDDERVAKMSKDCSRLVKDHASFYTPEKVGYTRSITPEGFLLCQGVPIARTGEQLYSEDELDGLTANQQGFITVSRHPDEVFSDQTLASFEGKPVTVNHPDGSVDPSNWKKLAVGHVQNVRRGAGIEDDLIVGDLLVTEADAIAYVNKHFPDISSGYSADYDQEEPGKATQRNIIGNHVAILVGARGRAGARVAFRDSFTDDNDGDTDMTAKLVERKFWRALRVGLNGLGIKTADADALTESLEEVATGDGDPDKELYKRLDAMDAQLKKTTDWIAGRMAKDAESEAAEAKARKEAEDKATKDAEEEKAEKERKEKEAAESKDESMEEEETGDTILEAESPGHVINLGKTWTGSMTGDAAATPEPVLQAVIARAEILAPGIAKPTADAIKGNKGVALATFMRTALEKHQSADAAGAENLKAFLLGKKVGDLRGANLVGVFNGVAQLARVRNNQSTVRNISQRGRFTGDFSKPVSGEAINKANAEFWAKQKA